jgi:hypothetical protein
LRASELSEMLSYSGLKLQEWRADLEDPNSAPAEASAPSSDSECTDPTGRPPLRLARLHSSSRHTIPVDVAEEVRELTGTPLLAGSSGSPPVVAVALPQTHLPVSSRAQALARSGGLTESTRRSAAAVRAVESAEVGVLWGRFSRKEVYKTVLARLTAVSPPGHFCGALGTLRRQRLWWRINGWYVGACVGVVVVGAGVLALCVFCPIAGIIVVANMLLISGAVGAAAAAPPPGRRA